MTRTPALRGAPLAAALLVTLTALTACGIGKNSETERSKTTITPRNATIGNLFVRAAYVAPDGTDSAKGFVVATFANVGTKPDTLTGVSSDGGSVAGSVNAEIAPRRLVSFVDPSSGMSGDSLELTASQPLEIGRWVSVTFTFSDAGSLTMKLPIEPTTGTTSVETPAPTGEPTETSSPSASPSESASATPSASASGSASPSASATP